MLTWMEKYGTMWKYLITPLLNPLKTNEKLYFITLNYTHAYILHHKFWILVKVNNKLNVEEQSITRIIVWDAKHALKKFRV